jgi:hypothetical protein
MKIKAEGFCETRIDIYQTVGCHIPEDRCCHSIRLYIPRSFYIMALVYVVKESRPGLAQRLHQDYVLGLSCNENSVSSARTYYCLVIFVILYIKM